MSPAAIAARHAGNISVIARVVATRLRAPPVVIPNAAATRSVFQSSAPAAGVGPHTTAVAAIAFSAIHASCRSHNSIHATCAASSSSAGSSAFRNAITVGPGSNAKISCNVAKSSLTTNSSTSASAINMQPNLPTTTDKNLPANRRPVENGQAATRRAAGLEQVVGDRDDADSRGHRLAAHVPHMHLRARLQREPPRCLTCELRIDRGALRLHVDPGLKAETRDAHDGCRQRVVRRLVG